jgi:hypothetical protein
MARGESRRTGKLPASRDLSRRGLLAAGAALALVVGGSALAVFRTRGYAPPFGRVLVGLSPWQFFVVEHAARRIAAPDRPADASIPSADDTDVAGFVDAWVARTDRRRRRDLARFLAVLEHVAPLACGFPSRFTRLGPTQQDATLASLESSGSDLLRAGFEGLKSLVFMGYYRDPRTWALIGYTGPFVAPQSGPR